MCSATPARFERDGWGESTVAIVVMGLVLAVTGIVRTLGTPASQPIVAFELFVSLLVPTGLATGGYWLANRNVSSAVRWQAVTQVSIGIVVACALAIWLTGYVTLEGGAIRDSLSLTTTLTPVGGAAGFVTAVREQSDGASAGSIGSSVTPRAGDTELPATVAPSISTAGSTAMADAPTGSTTERSAAVGAAPTAAFELSTTDVVATTERPSLNAPSDRDAARAPVTATGAKSNGSTAVWTDSDSLGRTAAPVRPLQSPDDTASDGAVSDAVGDSADSSGAFDAPEPDPFDGPVPDAVDDSADSLESPTPARNPGVETVAGVPSTAEAVLGVLRNEQARLALAVLYHEWTDEERSVDALARAVASHADDSADAVAIELRHATLPELADIRAVDWDPCTDRVSAADHAVFEEGVREASVLLEAFEPGTR